MRLRIGYAITFSFPQPTPLILTVNVHASRVADLLNPDLIMSNPQLPIQGYHDLYGNWCSRLEAPAGQLELTTTAVIIDSGLPDPIVFHARQHPVSELPPSVLLYLLGSRYCESDLLGDVAWQLFGHLPTGWPLVQAICDFVHGHIQFGYQHARVSMTAREVYEDRLGVCRDYAHLAIAFCRSLNIPARYCTGYLSDIGMPPPYGTMDFAAWFEVFLGGQWHVFDARNNTPCTGRILIARGRDAADVAISNAFGLNVLEHFVVWADEVPDTAE